MNSKIYDINAAKSATVIFEKKSKTIEGNRKRLRPIIKTIVLCARNNLPLRWYPDDADNSDESQNPALFEKINCFQ